MSNEVQRFIARVKPASDHPRFHEWQTATLCVFVGEDNWRRAQQKVEDEIRRRKWQRIEFTERSTLIKDRVREQGGAVWDAYRSAKSGSIFVREDLDDIPFSTKENGFVMMSPRLTEAFIDAVVERAGGARLTPEEANLERTKNADYRIGRFVFELKDLQSEGLEVKSRQAKIASLFRSKLRPDNSIGLDPALLSKDELIRYLDIVGRPIRKRLDSARTQVRATLDYLADDSLRGGVILLNTGYGTMAPDLMLSIAREHTNSSRTIEVVICISSWTLTNGFDTTVHFSFLPDETELHPIAPLRGAFWNEVDALMTLWGRGGFSTEGDAADPLTPLVFEDGGATFGIEVPRPPSSLPDRRNPQ